MKDVLVVYYSRSGRTRAVAEAIARALDADLEPIEDLRRRDGPFGYLRAGFDALFERLAPIAPPRHDPADYALVVLGTPVWVTRPTPAMRAYLERAGGRFRKIALFCSHGGHGKPAVFDDLARLCATAPLATLALREDTIDAGDHLDDLRAFAETLHASLGADPVDARRAERAVALAS